MIIVKGTARLYVNYEVTLDMTEEQFDALPYHEQTEHLDHAIDWYNTLRNADVDDIEVCELEEVEDSK